MNDIKFKVGDLVRLKSGGPVMTVSYAPGKTRVGCCWFPVKGLDELTVPIYGELTNAEFAVQTLQPVK